jgi:hypothetical protein
VTQTNKQKNHKLTNKTTEMSANQMFLKALATLYEKHFERIAQIIDDSSIAEDILKAHNLDVDSIDKSCCAELKLVLSKTHDFQISERLNKYGWTPKHISDHMLRFFEGRMRSAARVLTMLLKDGPDADFKRAVQGHESINVVAEASDSEDEAKYAVIGRHNRDFLTNIDDLGD